MAKKKARKEIKQEFNGKIEIYGILLILVAIIGCCKFKPASDIINGFSGFLVGVLWAVLLVIIGFIGAYMIVKRKKPDLLTSKLIGLYIVLMGFLSLFHLGYIRGLETQGITYGNIIDVEKLVKHGVKEKLTSYYNNRRNSLQRNICKAIIDNDCSPIDLDELVDKVSLVAFDVSKTTIKSTVVSMTNSSDIIGKMVIRDNHRNRNTERVDIILEIARNLKRDKSYTYKSELVKDIRRILDDHHDFTFTEGYIYNILRANSIDVEAVENETV